MRGIAAVLVLLAAFATQSFAADPYPTRVVKWIVGYPAGGSTDIFARLLAPKLSERLGQQFVVENRPGAANNIATDYVAKATADGYTLLLVNPANAINATLYKNLTFNFLNDFEPIAGIARAPNVMEVHPSVPVKTVAEFIAYAKANPGKINMASSGNGTSIHLLIRPFSPASPTSALFRSSSRPLDSAMSSGPRPKSGPKSSSSQA
jgi:tripartite-type tricarboxylate transporter receptor subunit TctC